MPSGSCYCGNVKISYTGTPIAQGLCHCWDCRKLSGSTYSTNVIVPADGFTVTGTPKAVPKKADSGADITNYFCGDCGTPLWGVGGFGDNKVVRAGILDGEALESAAPQLEIYAERRLGWLREVEGATSVTGMGNSQAQAEAQAEDAAATAGK